MAGFEANFSSPVTSASAAFPYLAALSDDEAADRFFLEDLKLAGRELGGTLYSRRPSPSWRSGRPPPCGRTARGLATAPPIISQITGWKTFASGSAPRSSGPSRSRSTGRATTSSARRARCDAPARRSRSSTRPRPRSSPPPSARSGRSTRPGPWRRRRPSPGARCGATTAGDDRFVIFTSGTTGEPKGVRLTYEAIRLQPADLRGVPGVRRPRRARGRRGDEPAPPHELDGHGRLGLPPAAGGAAAPPAVHDAVLGRGGGGGLRPALGGREALRRRSDTARRGAAGVAARRGAAARRVSARGAPRRFPRVAVRRGHAAGRPGCLQELRRGVRRRLVAGLGASGPTTVKRLEKWCACRPTVRFGSTETCLQVCGTPLGRPWRRSSGAGPTRGAASRARLLHRAGSRAAHEAKVVRSHAPHTEAKVVLCGPSTGFSTPSSNSRTTWRAAIGRARLLKFDFHTGRAGPERLRGLRGSRRGPPPPRSRAAGT